METLLFLTTYPIKGAFHGGQIRSQNIIKAYEKAGIKVITLAYYNPIYYPAAEISENDVKIPSQIVTSNDYYFTDDYLAGEYATKDLDLLNKLKSIFSKNQIKLIHFENPWLFKLAKKLKTEYKDLKLIFGSQNIEYKLKRAIYDQYGLIKEQRYVEMIDKIKNYELDAALNSDLLICVTEQDLNWFTENCKSIKEKILIPNAVEEFDLNPNQESIKALQSKFDSKDWCTFIASAHPPNLIGFENCVGDFISFLPPDSKLIIVGGICDLIKDYFNNSKYKELDKDRYVLVGKVPKNMLVDIINGSHTIILPITQGEGSNLKTAEALYSRKYVIGTTKSFRGYENYKDITTVTIVDSKKEFRNAIKDSYLNNSKVLSNIDKEKLKMLTWSNACLPLIQYLKTQI